LLRYTPKLAFYVSIHLQLIKIYFNAEYAKYHAHDGVTTDRRRKAAARTYFYMNEAQCERNMETFLQSIEAVSGTESPLTLPFNTSQNKYLMAFIFGIE